MEALMGNSLNLSLTDELRSFIDKNSGDGTFYATPSEFMRDLIREKKKSMEISQMRDGILQGYDDLIKGKSIKFNGSIKDIMAKAKNL